MIAESKPIELAISLKGEVLQSNFPEWCAGIKAVVAQVNQDLITDADFDRAAGNVKELKVAENALKDVKVQALKEAADIQALFAEIDDTGEEVRKARLGLDRQIKAKKEEARQVILMDAIGSIIATKHQKYERRIVSAMKGKKTVATQEAAATATVEAINTEIVATREIMEKFKAEYGPTLLPDPESLEVRDSLEVGIELTRRLERQRDEAEKQMLRDESNELRAKAMAAEQAKADAEKTKDDAIDLERIVAAVAPAEQTVADELAEFLATVAAGFAPAKIARANLKHPSNKAKAVSFAKALAAAWHTLKGVY
jgi:hypothetical protein